MQDESQKPDAAQSTSMRLPTAYREIACERLGARSFTDAVVRAVEAASLEDLEEAVRLAAIDRETTQISLTPAQTQRLAERIGEAVDNLRQRGDAPDIRVGDVVRNLLKKFHLSS